MLPGLEEGENEWLLLNGYRISVTIVLEIGDGVSCTILWI